MTQIAEALAKLEEAEQVDRYVPPWSDDPGWTLRESDKRDRRALSLRLEAATLAIAALLEQS